MEIKNPVLRFIAGMLITLGFIAAMVAILAVLGVYVDTWAAIRIILPPGDGFWFHVFLGFVVFWASVAAGFIGYLLFSLFRAVGNRFLGPYRNR